MGSGLAKAIREKYPIVYTEYRNFYDSVKDKTFLHGKIQLIPVEANRVIINFFAQDSYGYDGKCYTDNNFFLNCLIELQNLFETNNITLAFPWKIGCGLGGGDWDNDIYPMIIKQLNDKYNIEFWSLKGF